MILPKNWRNHNLKVLAQISNLESVIENLKTTFIVPCCDCRHDGFYCEGCPEKGYMEFEAVRGKL